jgi:Protein of unknown function (DUF3500)
MMFTPIDRRQFLAQAAAVTGTTVCAAQAAETATADSETLVSSLYRSLSAEQKSAVCFAYDNPLRMRVENSWMITPHKIGEFFKAGQQAMIFDIFRGLHNPEFVDKAIHHVDEDAGGMKNLAIAIFGEPGRGGRSEFVITGRHCTSRCDGNTSDGVAFAGPIMYGHQAGPDDLEKPGHPNNVYWFQAQRANEVFAAMDGKQREIALVRKAPRSEERNKAVELRAADFAGLPVREMSRDQRLLVEKVMADLLLPFRKKDTEEAMHSIRKHGGVDGLHMSFYKNMDIGNDGVWDVWQLESANMVWYFRGYPHVHTWVHIRA